MMGHQSGSRLQEEPASYSILEDSKGVSTPTSCDGIGILMDRIKGTILCELETFLILGCQLMMVHL